MKVAFVGLLLLAAIVSVSLAKEDVSRTQVQTGKATTTEGGNFNIEDFIDGVTTGVKKGLGKQKAKVTLMENVNNLEHKHEDVSVSSEEVTKNQQEQMNKVEKEDGEKAKNEAAQKASELTAKKRVQAAQKKMQKYQEKALAEQSKKKTDEQAKKVTEGKVKRAEEEKTKLVVQQAVERTKKEAKAAQVEMTEKAGVEAQTKQAAEEQSKKEVEDVKAKAALARHNAAQELEQKKVQEAQQKDAAKKEAEQKAEQEVKRTEQAAKRKAAALGTWCGCMGHRVYFERNNEWQTCPDGYVMTGMYRSNDQTLRSVQYFHCCKPCQDDGRTVLNVAECAQADWSRSFDSEGWSRCPGNSYMQGLYKSSCDWIYCLEYARCCKIQLSRGEANCDAKNSWGLSFDREGWSVTDQNKVMTGMYRSGGHALYNIELPLQCNFFSYN